MFRTTFYHNAAVVLSALMRCGVQGREEFLSEVRGKALQGGPNPTLVSPAANSHVVLYL